MTSSLRVPKQFPIEGPEVAKLKISLRCPKGKAIAKWIMQSHAADGQGSIPGSQ